MNSKVNIKMNMNIKKMGPLLLIMFLLQGCIAAAVVGGAAVGSISYFNRNRIKSYYHDNNIDFSAHHRIRKEPLLKDNAHIVVAVYHNVVLLAGQAVSPAQRIKAGQLVRSIPHVQKVYNEITIAGPTTTLTRSSDAWITGKVKTEMVWKGKLKSRNIKIVTENGVVYLLGEVSQEQAKIAADVARRVQGVQKVVMLFEIRRVP